MCGVFAMFLNRPLNDADIRLGRMGTAAVRHRGPDHGGEWMDRASGVYLGHRRLAIIDLSPASDQPMVRDGTAISYNGEIYNYRDLRDRLAGTTTFTTAGDTEVLLAAWRAHGPAALPLLDGMFAFALWDGQAAWIACDRFGEKTLYIATVPSGVILSSELAPLVALLSPTADYSPERIIPLVALGYVPAPLTMYPSIRRLAPAQALRITRGVAEAPTTYWEPPVATPGRSAAQPLSERELDRLHEILVESVTRRVEADVEPCLFLSGGVDSALVAAMLARDMHRSVRCITVSFPAGATHDESAGAKHVADTLGLEHEVLLSRDDPGSVSANYLYGLFGQPTDNLSTASVHQMATAAGRRGYRLAITGIGGDEVFFGYLKHQLLYKRRRYFGLPAWTRRMMGAALAPLDARLTAAAAFRNLYPFPDAERYLAVKNLPAYRLLRSLPGLPQWAERAYGGEGGPLEYAVPRLDLKDTMPNSQLNSLDVGSMRASLEMRTPFLSGPVVEAVAEFDPRSFLAFGQKSVLRRLLARYLPARSGDEGKRGLSFPPDRFLRHYSKAPSVPGVPASLAEAIWQRRDEARGWRRLATRLVLTAEFPSWLAAQATAAESLRTPINAPLAS